VFLSGDSSHPSLGAFPLANGNAGDVSNFCNCINDLSADCGPQDDHHFNEDCDCLDRENWCCEDEHVIPGLSGNVNTKQRTVAQGVFIVPQ